MEHSSSRNFIAHPPSLIDAYFAAREHEGRLSWASPLIGLSGVRALLHTQVPHDVARLACSLHDKGLSPAGWRCLRESLHILSIGNAPVKAQWLLEIFDRIQASHPPDSQWQTLSSQIRKGELRGETMREPLLRILSSWSSLCDFCPSPEHLAVFHQGWKTCMSHTRSLSALDSLCTIAAKYYSGYSADPRETTDFLRVAACAAQTCNPAELVKLFERILDFQKRYPTTRSLNGMLARNLEQREFSSPLFRATLDLLLKAERYGSIDEIVPTIEQLERNYSRRNWGTAFALDHYATYLELKGAPASGESPWVVAAFSRLFGMGCAGRENVDLISVDLLRRVSALPDRDRLVECIAEFNTGVSTASDSSLLSPTLQSDLGEVLRHLYSDEALAAALDHLKLLAPYPEGITTFCNLLTHSGLSKNSSVDAVAEERWVRHCGELAFALRESRLPPDALGVLPAGLLREGDNTSFDKVKLILPRLLRESSVFESLTPVLRNIRVTELIRKLLLSANDSSAVGTKALLAIESLHDGLPYAQETKNPPSIEAVRAQREVFQIFSNLFDLSFGFGSLTFDARRPPGSAPALVRFGEQVAGGTYYINASDNQVFPGRGFVLEGIDPYLAFGSDVETLKEKVAPWAAEELDELQGALFILQRGLLAISCPRSPRFKINGDHYSYVVYNNEFYPGAEVGLNVPTEILFEKLQRSLIPIEDYTGPRQSSDTPDIAAAGLTYSELSAAAQQRGINLLNIGWGSNLGGLANAYPAGSSPHFEWEQKTRGTRDIWGHLHKAHSLGSYSGVMTRKLEARLSHFRTLHAEVYALNRSYQRLFNIFQMALSLWHKSHALEEAYRWHHAGHSINLPRSEFPIVCQADVFQYAVKPSRRVRLDTYSLTLEVRSEDGTSVTVPLPTSGTGQGSEELDVWDSYVTRHLRFGDDLRFFHRDSVG